MSRDINRTKKGSSPIRAKTCGSVLCTMLRGRLTGVESSSSSPLDSPWTRYCTPKLCAMFRGGA
jgi:hypothetical protein